MPVAQSVRPTYVGIGAQKCASTWLHRILAEHPQIAVPAAKEVDFFSCHYDHGYQWYQRCFAEAASARARGEISPAASARARGEISPSYFCEPAVPERIARYVPEAKILLSLRDPVERALSNHRHEVRAGHLTGDDISFEAGLANNPMYVEQGLYATYLRAWLRHFPRERILVVLTEDVEVDARAVSRLVYSFLGVDENFVPLALEQRFNQSFATRSSVLAGVKDAIYRATRVPAVGWLWDAAAGAGLRSMYRNFNRLPSSAVIPRPRKDTLAWLRQRFEPEVRDLETILGRSLQTWLEH